jgi:hypothetical protein
MTDEEGRYIDLLHDTVLEFGLSENNHIHLNRNNDFSGQESTPGLLECDAGATTMEGRLFI